MAPIGIQQPARIISFSYQINICRVSRYMHVLLKDGERFIAIETMYLIL